MKSIVFFGSGDFSKTVLEILLKDFEVKSIVTETDKPKGRSLTPTPNPVAIFANNAGLKVIKSPRINSEKEKLKEFPCDFFVVASFGQIIADDILNMPHLESLNLHPSLLPKYRGSSPIQQTLLSEDKVTGNSIIKITDKLDAGPIFKQSKIKISPDDNYITLSQKLATDGAVLLKEVMQNFKDLKPSMQNEKMASYTSIILKDDGLIKWNESAHTINAKIKAFAAWPTCFTGVDNLILIIRKAEVTKLPANKPGQITINNGEVLVSASDYYLRILFIQPSGKKEMDNVAFANGYKRLNGKILNV
ncbi:MAG: Methionyl-tRNA formyltransferase [candidate division CPR2 bacterium GW2011_GWC1_39_9]|uniref:Methionyl-tRNA formyltransferase n=1 Tax=candidate division CPR2 bacterium GW2011_GWC2_39_10 TaxID=1618345 RepID=A0A0G0LR12_UNCC2|nr:MAG: Methionyl-tRNA formyltransferase [candidate division CPR2 bacterium GW2011_GWC2_39_10]KKR36091.1 MAG: Methionyl-tRNA formyltransferase [candidate division CPR2 bacterium GW2011_GWC1_39_9]